ncbi:hypothetical protein L7F22_011033 [Adiantum nelumboides]|nr:hypothetical protein [Adiantum nelumboides]
MEQEVEDMPEGPAKEYLLYEKKVMESAALAFLQPEEQIKDFASDFLSLSLMRHEANLWKEKMRPAVPRNEDGGYEGISLTSEEAKTLIEDHPSSRIGEELVYLFNRTVLTFSSSGLASSLRIRVDAEKKYSPLQLSLAITHIQSQELWWQREIFRMCFTQQFTCSKI